LVYNSTLGGNQAATFWWADDVDEAKVHIYAVEQLRFLDQNQIYMSQKNLRNTRLYGNLDVMGLTPFNYLRSTGMNTNLGFPSRVTYNIVQSCIDTLVAKIAKQKIKPSFLTKGGDYYAQKKAKQLDKFMAGQFHKANIGEIARRTLLDALILGTGAIKVYEEDGEVKFERVFVEQLKCDELEGFTGNPRTLYQYSYVDRKVCMGLYPDHAEAIRRAPSAAPTAGVYNLQDLILIVESWRLPSNQDKTDGKHCICVDGATLLLEPWERDNFPFVWLKYTQLPLGFWADGLADQLVGIQVEVNRTLYSIQQAMRLMSAPKVLVDAATKIPAGTLNNETGAIIRYTGKEPNYVAPTPISPVVMEYLETLYRKAYEISGISQLSATGKKPSGLDSGKALREYSDIESERFISLGQKYEDLHIQLATQAIHVVRNIIKRTGSYKSLAFDRKHGIEEIHLDNIGEPDDYIIQCFPASMLSQTPAGRKQDVVDLIQAGLIPQEYALDLLDFPDLEAFSSLANSGLKSIEKILDKIQQTEEYIAPEPYLNLQLARKIGHQYYLRAMTEDHPEKVQDLLRMWVDDVQAMIDALQAPPAPEATAAPEVPLVPEAAAAVQPEPTMPPAAAGVVQPSLA